MAIGLVIAFLLVPVVEIYVIIQVGQLIGPLPTVALLVAESLLGAWLVRREGRTAWTALRTAAASGRLPGRELADAALVLVGGTLLLTPGFVTDLVGFFFVLPPTRPLARRALGWLVARRAARAVSRRFPWMGPPGPPGGRSHQSGPRIVRGEAVRGEAVPDEAVPDEPVRGEAVPGEAVPDERPGGEEPPHDMGPGRATGG